MEKFHIGKVLKPQGINGQIKIADYTDGLSSVKNIKVVYLDNDEYKVLNLSAHDGALILALKGVADRNTAELLRGKEVYALRDEIEKDDDRFFIVDIIGCALYLSSGKHIGEIIDIKTTNVDIFVAQTQEGVCYFPFLKKLNYTVDIENKKITVDSKAFTEVVFYEGK